MVLNLFIELNISMYIKLNAFVTTKTGSVNSLKNNKLYQIIKFIFYDLIFKIFSKDQFQVDSLRIEADHDLD